MNVIIVAGYGDATGYIRLLTKHWPRLYGLQPHIHAFGSTDDPETYDQHWQEFMTVVESLAPVAVIGISFGFSIAARAILDAPDKVPKIISIAGPHDPTLMDPETLTNKYPMLKKALAAFDSTRLPANKIMTLTPLRDGIVNPRLVMVSGARNQRLPVAGHMTGIGAALLFRGRSMARFIKGRD